MWKVACFLDDGAILVDSLFKAIPTLHFLQETLQQSGFVVNSENPIWEPQEAMTELGIVLELRTKMFHISNTGIESILLYNLTTILF